MARIFTTKFKFNGQHYDAIVTISSEENKLNFSVRLMDDELFALIPDGHVKYQGKDGFKQIANLESGLASSLMKSIAAAIDEYTQTYC